MTRRFNQRVRCQSCGAYTTEESPFERWVRNKPELSSGHGIVRFDIDLLLHRYMFITDGKGSRDIQAMMFVEIKTFMAVPSEAQRDTLHLLNQVLRNRKQNIHGIPRHQLPSAPVKAHSLANKRDVRLWLLGGHLLQMDGTCPADSGYMLWDRTHKIDADSLTELLLFERDPDNPLRRLDIRRRSQPFRSLPTLFET